MKFKNYKTKRARLEIRNDRMQNTGTWNSDLACIFFVCLLAPICWYFFIAALQAHAAMNAYKATKNNVPKEPTPPKPSKPMQISVSFNLPNLKGWGQQPQQQPQPNRSKPPKKVASKSKPKRKSKPKQKTNTTTAVEPQTPLTNPVVKDEAVMAMSNLGFRKKDALRIVNDLCDKNKYDSTESLIKACFVCI